MRLQRLTRAGRAFVTDAFLSNPEGRLHLPPSVLEPAEKELPLDDVERLVRTVVRDRRLGDRGIDAFAAVRLRAFFPLPRRAARELGIWHYLSAVAFPEFVRHRFEPDDSGRWNRTRFLGTMHQNAFARLWWAAEHCRDGDDYSLVSHVFEHRLERVFDWSFSWHRPALVAFANVLANQSKETIEAAARDLNHALSTITLEALEVKQVERLLGQIVKRVQLDLGLRVEGR